MGKKNKRRTARHTCMMYEYEAEIVKSRTNNEPCHPHPMVRSLLTAVRDRHSNPTYHGTGQLILSCDLLAQDLPY